MIRVNAEAISYDSASGCLDARKVDTASAVCFAHDSYAKKTTDAEAGLTKANNVLDLPERISLETTFKKSC